MEKFNELKSKLATVHDLQMASYVLSWDNETYMPPGGAEARGRQLATLSRLAHEKFTAAEVCRLLDDLRPYEESLPYDSDEAALIRVTRREFERRVKVPAEFIARMNDKIGHCIGPGLNDREWIAWGHFTYNIGTSAFCNSSAARYLREGKYMQACAQMGKWVYITKPDVGKVNCRVKANKCGGLPKRRDLEMKWCLDAQTDGSWLG